MSNDKDSNYLKAYSIADSKRKIDQIQSILNQKIGSSWKQVIFAMVLLLVAIVLLIIFGINIDNNPYRNTLSHVKVFSIIFVLSICLFFVWIIIKPYLDTQQKGVVPFPPADTLVPVDSSQCGLMPTLCENAGDCSTLCAAKQGQSNYNYSCHTVKHPNTYYLGSKLEVEKSYCLPNISEINDISDCGTYTGRIVWSKNPDNTLSWKCQCLYPDIFSGSNCTEQVACVMNYMDGVIPKKNIGVLKDKDGNVWSGTDAPPGNSKTPYDTLPDGTPRFKCSCGDNGGFYSTNDDPFTCNEDICLSGDGHSDVASFDTKTNKCICSLPTYQSNISGFCYALDTTDKLCNLNPNGDGCRYGIDIGYVDVKNNNTKIPVMYYNNEKYYMTNNTFDGLLDVTSVVINNSLDNTKQYFVDISKTVLKDAFYSYEAVAKVVGNEYLTEVKDNIAKGIDMTEILHNLLSQATRSINPGVARKCNSYFYRRDGYDNCQDMLSKTGTEPIVTGMECGKIGNIVIDLNYYPWGYHCDCGNKGRKDPGCGTVSTGWHTVQNGDDQPPFQVYGKYIDRVICNDYDPEQIKKGPQQCNECTADGTDLDGGKDYKSCCLYEVDKGGKQIANFRKNGDFVVPSEDNIIPDTDSKKCAQRERTSCSDDKQCLGGKRGNYGCATSDRNDKYICCPNSSYSESGRGTGYWCDQLDKGDKCYYDYQCVSGKCNNAPDKKSTGGGTCA